MRGALVYPSAIEDVLAGRLAPGAEWRIEVGRERGEAETLTVRYEHPDRDLHAGLAGRPLPALGLEPILETVPPGEFERFSAKAKRVIDRRAP